MSGKLLQVQQLYRDPKLTSVTRTWNRQDNFIVTQNLSSTYRDLQKPRHRDTDANSIKPPGRYS